MSTGANKSKLFEVMRLGPVWEAKSTAAPASALAKAQTEVLTAAVEHPPNLLNVAMTPTVKFHSLDDLRKEVAGCHACALSQSRTKTVFADGVPNSPIMVIGEAPGADEDACGFPFVGRAGQLLERMLAAIDCARKANVYITNTVKCRPPDNRDPEPAEAQACMGYLHQQIVLNQPKVLFLVGKVAIKALLNDSRQVGELRGQVHLVDIQGQTIKAVVGYHPAYLLRAPQAKAKAWEDLLLLKRTALAS